MAQQRLQLTLAILKPDLICRPRATQAVKNIISNEGFHTVRSTKLQWSMGDAQQFYSEHKGKFFYDRLVSYMSSSPIESLVLAHPMAIEHWRKLMGPTKSYVARVTAPNTIRGTYGLTDTRNSTHGSDSEATAQREIKFFCKDFDFEWWFKNEEPKIWQLPILL